MKIALIGYGKMGKTIDGIIKNEMPNHEVVLRIDRDNELDYELLEQADVAIEFSTPSTAVNNIKQCFKAQIPVVVGTTGWLQDLDQLKEEFESSQFTLFTASNFSIGVNIFFEVNKKLAQLMGGNSQYDIKLEEIHHTEKLDSPSGTAITLASGILNAIESKTRWVNSDTDDNNSLPIISKRVDNVPGTHEIQYSSAVDTISIKHTAHSRLGFAYGAIKAAEWVKDKKGFFEMKDMLNL